MKTLVLTALILGVCAMGNIGTKSAQARNLTINQALVLKHSMILSKHKIDWYHGRGHWTLHEQFNSCKTVALKFSQRRADICYHARVTLERHAERYKRIYAILHPPVLYVTGSYDWDSLVSKCEAKGAGWYANTGNGFFFGPQFTPQTWHANGGPAVLEMDGYGVPMRSFSLDFIKHVGYNVIQSQGPGAWPNCNGYLFGKRGT